MCHLTPSLKPGACGGTFGQGSGVRGLYIDKIREKSVEIFYQGKPVRLKVGKEKPMDFKEYMFNSFKD